ncbi:sensor histidine kinase [Blautia schinkii]|nr:sensor histidine kinase [Blautia schinkii]
MKKDKNTYLLPAAKRWLWRQGLVSLCVMCALLNGTIREELGFELACGLLLFTFIHGYWGVKHILMPIAQMNKTFQAVAEGYTVQDLFQLEYNLTPEHKQMLTRIEALLDAKELLDSSRKQAEYLALQNQINPHFLYNTLEGIRSEALLSHNPGIAHMTETLSNFFRYTISNLDTMVTVEDELRNVDNYYQIQKYRFGDRMELLVEYEDGDETRINMCQMPKLILQPVVENAIRHGLEPKVENGTIRIRFQITDKRLLIFISDDGVGMEKEQLERLNNQLRGTRLEVREQDSPRPKGGIAMVNVNNRIKLIYGDSYGMQFYSTKGYGTDVEITLPAVQG